MTIEGIVATGVRLYVTETNRVSFEDKNLLELV